VEFPLYLSSRYIHDVAVVSVFLCGCSVLVAEWSGLAEMFSSSSSGTNEWDIV
jgi:hypothetical protein